MSDNPEPQGDEDAAVAAPGLFVGKCAKCGRKARKGCTQSVCLKCCTDFENCRVHKEQRDQATFREQVLDGTTEIQKALRVKKSKLILKGRFREAGFAYMGDTVIIWNLRDYLLEPKWKEDALRRSSKRLALLHNSHPAKSSQASPKPSRRQRFRKVMQELYEQQVQSFKA